MSLTAALITLATLNSPEIIEVDTQLDTLVISSSRSEEKVTDIPASISIIDEKALAETMKHTPELQQILSIHVPGFAPSSASTSNSGQTLRGRNALILIDGIPQSTPLRNGSLGVRTIDPSALQRIEVVKGASSLYGHGASGGLVNYITKEANADSEFSGDVGISARVSTQEPEDSLSKRIDTTMSGTKGQFTYLVSGAYDSYGEQKDAEGDTLGLVYGLSDLETQNLLTKFGWNFDDQQRVKLSYNYFTSQQDTDLVDEVGDYKTGTKTQAVKNDTGNSRVGDPQGPKDNYNVMLKYEHDKLFSQTSFSADVYKQRIENVFFYSTRLANPDEGLEGGQSVILSEKQGVRTDFTSRFKFDQLATQVTYGIDFLNDISSQVLVDGRTWVPEMDMLNKAAYVQSSFNWDDSWVLKAGIRHQETEVAVDDYSTLKLCSSADTCSTPVNVEGGSLDYDLTTYNIGLRYTGNSLFSPFVSYSEGYDISDIGRLLRSATVTNISDVRTEASLVEHYEIGIDSQIDQLHIEVAIYQSKSTLGTSTKLDADSGIYLPVRAPQDIQGFELLADYTLSGGQLIGMTYSHVEGENPDTHEALSGRYISPDKLTAFVDWPLNQTISFSADYMYVGSRDEFDANEEGGYGLYQGPVDSYQVMNASITYQQNQWQYYAALENALNEDYFSAKSQSIVSNSSYSKAPGRTLVMGTRFQF